uniref:Transposase Tc1-like domain-containing protein n=1 Tax=Oncorhynchus mykiss TaxID=8022 RepID=A0A8K9XPI7_ONCMY
MGKTKDLSAFERGMVISVRRTGLSVSRTATMLNKLPRSTVSAVIVKWRLLRATTVQPRSGRPDKLTELDHRLSSVVTLTNEFLTASGSNISTQTVHRELQEMGFHDRAATHKPKITMYNAKRRLDVEELDWAAQSPDLNPIEHL